jgi:hypothetical protein
MCKELLIFSNIVHLGPRTGLPDKILKGDHQRIILAKLESNWLSSFRGKKIKLYPPFLFLTVAMLVGRLDCRTQFWKFSSNWPSSFRNDFFFKFHPPFLFLVTATMLVGDRDCRTHFWKGITHGPFQFNSIQIFYWINA